MEEQELEELEVVALAIFVQRIAKHRAPSEEKCRAELDESWRLAEFYVDNRPRE